MQQFFIRKVGNDFKVSPEFDYPFEFNPVSSIIQQCQIKIDA